MKTGKTREEIGRHRSREIQKNYTKRSRGPQLRVLKWQKKTCGNNEVVDFRSIGTRAHVMRTTRNETPMRGRTQCGLNAALKINGQPENYIGPGTHKTLENQ